MEEGILNYSPTVMFHGTRAVSPVHRLHVSPVLFKTQKRQTTLENVRTRVWY